MKIATFFGQQGADGSVKRATVILAGTRCMFFDSPVKHAFGFTAAISMFINWLCWLRGRWGVSWQFNLP